VATLFFVPVVFSLLHKRATVSSQSVPTPGPGGIGPAMAGA